MRSKKTLLVLALLLALIAAAFFARRAREPRDPLEDALLAVRAELEWPGLDVKAAAKELGTRDRVLAFVKDEVARGSYRGSWQGADGTLRTRVANAADRAVLLAALLRELGLEVRLARADWPRQATPHEPAPPAREVAALARLRALLPERPRAEVAPLDTTALAAEIGAARERLSALVAKAWPQTALDAVPARATGGSTAAPIGELVPPSVAERDWVWVQVKKGASEWEDLDPVFPDEKRPLMTTAPFEPAATRVALAVDAIDAEDRRHALVDREEPASSVLGRAVSLALLPGTCRIDELDRIPTPESVKLWAPCLQVGGELVATGAFAREGVFLGATERGVSIEGASAPLVAREPASEAAPALESVALASVDERSYPRVHVALRVKPATKLTWRAQEIAARDEQGPLPVLVESALEARRPVILLLDVSESMRDEDRLAIAKKALRVLVERLEPDQPVALLVFSSFVRTVQELSPLAKCKADLLRKIDALEPSPSTCLLKALDEALALSAEPATVVLLTDGVDSDKGLAAYPPRVAALLAKLRASRDVVLPVGIGEADDALLARIAREKSAPFLRLAAARDLPRMEQAFSVIGRELAGGLRFSFVARGGEPGAERVAKVRLAGAEKDVAVPYRVPATTSAPGAASSAVRRLELTVTLLEAGEEPRRLVHTIARLDGGPADAWHLLVAEEVGISVGASPVRALLARRADEALDLLALRRLGATGALPAAVGATRGVSTRAGLIAARSAGLLRSLAGTTPVAGAGPFVFVERARWEPHGDALVRRTDLDFLAPPLVAAPEATFRQRAALGLALATVEGALLGAPSVNAKLVAAPDLEVDEIDGALVARAASVPGVSWRVAKSGDVKARLDDAKGASAEEAAARFKQLHSLLGLLGWLGDKGMGAGGVPFGSLLKGLCLYFDELMKYWCYSSVMLGLVGEGIEAGKFDAKAAEKDASKLCDLPEGMKGMGRKLAGALIGGFAKGVVDDATGKLRGGSDDYNNWTTAGGIATGVAQKTDPIPNAVGKALEDAIAQTAGD